jgi:hypothetical protein
MRRSQLQQRAAEGRPIRVGLIGAGKFGSMYLAQVPRTPGVHLVGIADLSPEAPCRNLARVGWEPQRVQARQPRRGAARRQHPRRRRLAGAGARTRHRHDRRMHRPPHCRGRPHAWKPLPRQARGQRHGGGRRLLRAAAGATRGRSRRAVLLAFGDQPALICDLVDWARTCGFPGGGRRARPQVAAALQRITPDTVWNNWGLTPEQAARGGLNPKMFNSFLDGSKPSIESTAVANATGPGPCPATACSTRRPASRTSPSSRAAQ